jgi:hypothetical protein
MPKWFCAACGTRLRSRDQPCRECGWQMGTSVSGDKRFCTGCGTLKPKGEDFCPKCTRGFSKLVEVPRWLSFIGYLFGAILMFLGPMVGLAYAWIVIQGTLGRTGATAVAIIVLRGVYPYTKVFLLNALAVLRNSPDRYDVPK